MKGRLSSLIRTRGAAAIVLGSVGLLLATAAPAGASGSLSPPVNPLPTSCSTSLSLPVKIASRTSVGFTMTESCTFATGSMVSISFGGKVLHAAKSDGGTGHVTIKGDAKDPEISVDGSAYQPAAYGVNTIVASGTNPSGGSNTANFLVDLENISTSSSSSSSTNSSGLAFTGADLLALIAAAMALMILGTCVVLYTRRRAEQRELRLAEQDLPY